MKDKIIDILKNEKDYISGENISNRLGVTRAAVWKSIKRLEKDGYIIESKNKLGYRLNEMPDRLYPRELSPYLNTNIIGKQIVYFDEINSTNIYLKNYIKESDMHEGSIIVAETQTQGKGRLGRTWISPKYKGLYFSMLIMPNISLDNIGHITILFALAICKGIEEYTGEKFEIKWPNDILYKGKKVCGILTEISGEIDAIPHVIVGIGINVNSDIKDFDIDLMDMITSLKIILNKQLNRIELMACILNKMDEYYMKYINDNDFKSILKEYKNRLKILNKEVIIYMGKNKINGIATDIMNNGALQIRLPDGETKEYISGEISLNKFSFIKKDIN